MIYEVRITPQAERDIQAICGWWSEHHSEKQAERWYDNIYPSIHSLEKMPRRCPLAPEDDLHNGEVRHFLFGTGRRPTHRIIFAVEGEAVIVLSVRHVAQVTDG